MPEQNRLNGQKFRGADMQVIRRIIDRKDIQAIFVPEYFGDKVEIIVLPLEKKHGKISRESEYLMHLQEKSGFADQVLNNPDEDVWNDI